MWHGVVATIGSPGLHEETGGIHIVDVSRADGLVRVFESVTEPVLVVAHPAHRQAAAVASALLAGHRPTLPVAQLHLDQAPMACLAALQTVKGITRDAGYAASLWRDFARQAWSGVALSSVTRLERPNPTIGQHVRSLLPGSRFLVRSWPTPATFVAGRVGAALAGIRRGSVDMYVSDDAKDSLTRAIVDAVSPQSVRPVDLPGVWAAAYGREPDLHVALLPVDAGRNTRPRGAACLTCELAAGEYICDFCRTRTGAISPRGTVQVGAPALSKKERAQA